MLRLVEADEFMCLVVWTGVLAGCHLCWAMAVPVQTHLPATTLLGWIIHHLDRARIRVAVSVNC